MKATLITLMDVGSSRISMETLEQRGQRMRTLFQTSEPISLGEGYFASQILDMSVLRIIVQSLELLLARGPEVERSDIRVLITGAQAQARNVQTLVAAFKEQLGLNAELFSEEQKAKWLFHGVSSDPALDASPLGAFHIGANGTAFAIGEGGFVYGERSWTLGAGRLVGEIRPSAKPSTAELAQGRAMVSDFLHWEAVPQVQATLRAFCRRHLDLTATGHISEMLFQLAGSAATERISPAEATDLANSLWSLPRERRQSLPGLPPVCSELILGGALVLEGILQRFGLPELRLSRHGIRHGALIDPVQASFDVPRLKGALAEALDHQPG